MNSIQSQFTVLSQQSRFQLPLFFALLASISVSSCGLKQESALELAEKRLLSNEIPEFPGSWAELNSSDWATSNRIFVSVEPTRALIIDETISLDTTLNDGSEPRSDTSCRIRKSNSLSNSLFRVQKVKPPTDYPYAIVAKNLKVELLPDATTARNHEACSAFVEKLNNELNEKLVTVFEFKATAPGYFAKKGTGARIGGPVQLKKLKFHSDGPKGCARLDGVFASSDDINEGSQWNIVQNECDAITLSRRNLDGSVIKELVVQLDGTSRKVESESNDQEETFMSAQWLDKNQTKIAVKKVQRHKNSGLDERFTVSQYSLEPHGDLSLSVFYSITGKTTIERKVRQ